MEEKIVYFEKPGKENTGEVISLVSLSGMVETPRLQAKQVFGCREATYEPRLY